MLSAAQAPGQPRKAIPCYIDLMFSPKLERRWRFRRLALLVSVTLFAVGIALIGIWALRASSMLAAADAHHAPLTLAVLIALAGLLVLCLIVYGALIVFGRSPFSK
jgi:hypothetical protein